MDELIYPLLEEEKESDNIWRLALALARYGSRTSMEAAARIIDEFPNHSETSPVVKTLYSQYMVFDPQHPDLEQLKARIEEAEKQRADQEKEMRDLFSFVLGPTGLENKKEPRGRIVAPRETPKIGRNDRCPCASGEKYKKCCLN